MQKDCSNSFMAEKQLSRYYKKKTMWVKALLIKARHWQPMVNINMKMKNVAKIMTPRTPNDSGNLS